MTEKSKIKNSKSENSEKFSKMSKSKTIGRNAFFGRTTGRENVEHSLDPPFRAAKLRSCPKKRPKTETTEQVEIVPGKLLQNASVGRVDRPPAVEKDDAELDDQENLEEKRAVPAGHRKPPRPAKFENWPGYRVAACGSFMGCYAVFPAVEILHLARLAHHPEARQHPHLEAHGAIHHLQELSEKPRAEPEDKAWVVEKSCRGDSAF